MFADIPGGSTAGIILLIVNLSMKPSIPHVLVLAKRFDATKEDVTVNPTT
jgi:hypothetical protein